MKGSWLCSGVTDPFNILVSVLELKLLQCCFYFRDLFSRDAPLRINTLKLIPLSFENCPLYFPSSTGSLRAQQTALAQPGQVWVFAVKLSMLRGGRTEAQEYNSSV